MVQEKMQEGFDVRGTCALVQVLCLSILKSSRIPTLPVDSYEVNGAAYIHAETPDFDGRRGVDGAQAGQGGVRMYIADWPSTIAFVHGLQGSGKTSLMVITP
jgi:hypothetical protein